MNKWEIDWISKEYRVGCMQDVAQIRERYDDGTSIAVGVFILAHAKRIIAGQELLMVAEKFYNENNK